MLTILYMDVSMFNIWSVVKCITHIEVKKLFLSGSLMSGKKQVDQKKNIDLDWLRGLADLLKISIFTHKKD